MAATEIRGCLDHPNPIQLGLIREIHQELAAGSIPHWLGGGWALDFLLGEALRVHSDVDWSIWKRDAAAVSVCLGDLGYTRKVVRHPEEHIGFRKHAQYVSFGLLEKTSSGDVVTSGRWTDWPYPQGSLSAPEGQLGDVVCPIVSAEAQLDEKLNFHKHPAGAPRRDVDIVAIAKLGEYLGSQGASRMIGWLV